MDKVVDFKTKVNDLNNAGKGEDGFKESLIEKLDALLSKIEMETNISTSQYFKLKEEVNKIEKSGMATSSINPHIDEFAEKISMLDEIVSFLMKRSNQIYEN